MNKIFFINSLYVYTRLRSKRVRVHITSTAFGQRMGAPIPSSLTPHNIYDLSFLFFFFLTLNQPVFVLFYLSSFSCVCVKNQISIIYCFIVFWIRCKLRCLFYIWHPQKYLSKITNNANRNLFIKVDSRRRKKEIKRLHSRFNNDSRTHKLLFFLSCQWQFAKECNNSTHTQTGTWGKKILDDCAMCMIRACHRS